MNNDIMEKDFIGMYKNNTETCMKLPHKQLSDFLKETNNNVHNKSSECQSINAYMNTNCTNSNMLDKYSELCTIHAYIKKDLDVFKDMKQNLSNGCHIL